MTRSPRRSPTLAAAVMAAGAALPAAGQSSLDRPTGRTAPYALDSGPVAAASPAFSDVVAVEGARWLRLYFGNDTRLAGGSAIRLTALLDGETQVLDAAALARWRGTSAYFNGDTVLVELLPAGGTADNRVVVGSVALSEQSADAESSGPCGICGDDDRVPADEPWAGRLLPAGCTVAVFNEASCMVSAGHCMLGKLVVEFMVPESGPGCRVTHPPVSDQFPVEALLFADDGVGDDWAVLRPGPNDLGELPYERYGELRPIAAAPASAGGHLDVWGYGIAAPCALSQTQQTSGGDVVGVEDDHYLFDVDVQFGNSGSALLHDGAIVGVVTHCSFGCPNLGTRVDDADFAAALADLCAPRLEFGFPDGLPAAVDPDGGDTVRVVVSQDSATPEPGTGRLHVSVDGGPFTATPMSENAPNDYVAVFPPTACGTVVEFYFSAETGDGLELTSPPSAPATAFCAFSAQAMAPLFADDFETDRGWSVTGAFLGGPWQRAVPLPPDVCDDGGPGADADGSGHCYLTGAGSGDECGGDVDGGSTVLTSPPIPLDAGTGEPVLAYWRWYFNAQGPAPGEDVFEVQLEAGASGWTSLETVGPGGPATAGGWLRRGFRLADLAGPAGQIRIRFIASDQLPGSVVEAAVDGVLVGALHCCPWDLGGDGAVGVTDLLELLAQWGASPNGPPDFDGDGAVGVPDLDALLSNWGPCTASTAPRVMPRSSQRR